MIWGLITIALSLSFSRQEPLTSKEVKNTKIEITVAPLEYQVTTFWEEESITTIPLNIIVDTTTYNIENDYNKILDLMNKNYNGTGVKFILNSISFSGVKIKDFRSIIKSELTSSEINVYILGIHSGEEIGLAALNGYRLSRGTAVVDFSEVFSNENKADMISHEVGHLFGLDHTIHKTLMSEYSHEEDLDFSDYEKRKIEKSF